MSEHIPSDELFTNPEAPCCLGPDHEGCPGCPKEERALRAICSARYRPMTQAERDYCKRQIASVEGYSEADADGTDSDVASTVLRGYIRKSRRAKTSRLFAGANAPGNRNRRKHEQRTADE